MDLGRLRTLRELANRQTMAAVAEALCLTPSAVSQQIAQLEDEVGQALTERRGRGVKLTPAGELLAAHVDRLLAVLGEARSELALLQQEVAGTLRVAAFATAAAALLPPAMQALRASHPRLEITVVEMEPADGLAALGSWDADLAIVDDLTVRLARVGRTIERVSLLDDQLHVVMAPGHRLAGSSGLTLPQLQDEEWALDSAGSFYGEFVLDLCRRAGYTPRVNAECRGAEIITAMVAAGCSISVIPGLRLGQMAGGLTAVPLRPEVKRRISVAFRHGEKAHPAIRLVAEELRVAVRGLRSISPG